MVGRQHDFFDLLPHFVQRAGLEVEDFLDFHRDLGRIGTGPVLRDHIRQTLQQFARLRLQPGQGPGLGSLLGRWPDAADFFPVPGLGFAVGADFHAVDTLGHIDNLFIRTFGSGGRRPALPYQGHVAGGLDDLLGALGGSVTGLRQTEDTTGPGHWLFSFGRRAFRVTNNVLHLIFCKVFEVTHHTDDFRQVLIAKML